MGNHKTAENCTSYHSHPMSKHRTLTTFCRKSHHTNSSTKVPAKKTTSQMRSYTRLAHERGTCGQVCIGITKRSINTRIIKHKRYCGLEQKEKSAIAEHALEAGHKVEFENTKLLARIKDYRTREHREATEISKHVHNMNRKEETRSINKVWLPVLNNRTIVN